MKVVAISQARTGSTRLPGKVFETISETPLLKVHLDRVGRAKRIDEVVVATTDLASDSIIESKANQWGYRVVRGSENDVLSRYRDAALFAEADVIVRITSDCPFVDPELIDEVVHLTIEAGADYGSNTLLEAYPDGQDIECFTREALFTAYAEAQTSSDREHVTPFIKRNSDFHGGTRFRAVNLPSPVNYNHVRMCVDEPADLEVARALALSCGLTAGWLEYTQVYLDNLAIASQNATIVRNEGYLKSLEKDAQNRSAHKKG